MAEWTLTHTPPGGSPETKLLGGSEQPGDDARGQVETLEKYQLPAEPITQPQQ